MLKIHTDPIDLFPTYLGLYLDPEYPTQAIPLPQAHNKEEPMQDQAIVSVAITKTVMVNPQHLSSSKN